MGKGILDGHESENSYNDLLMMSRKESIMSQLKEFPKPKSNEGPNTTDMPELEEESAVEKKINKYKD